MLNINVREYRRSNQKRTIQRNWQHRRNTNKTPKKPTNKQNIKHNTICVGHHYVKINTNDVNAPPPPPYKQ